MEILLTGGTGFIGAAVLERLIRAGHHVTAVVRSEGSADAVSSAGAAAVVGDLTDAAWLAAQLADVDAAIHTAAAGDETDAALNDAVIAAVTEAFGATTKPFVHTGGVWTYGSNDDIDDDDAQQPIALTGWRLESEARLLAADVKASVIRPGIVYGHGAGIPAMLAGGPRDDDGALVLIGSGEQHWATVHVDDLADLYVLVLEKSPGGVYVGAGGQSPSVRELTEAVAGEAGSVVAGSADEAAARLGEPFAEALLLDQQASGDKARALGWEPTAPGLVDLLAKGYPAGE